MLYASVWRRVFGVVVAIGEVYRVEHPRWPWRIAVELRARAVIELPAGRLDDCDLKPGDRLYLAPPGN